MKLATLPLVGMLSLGMLSGKTGETSSPIGGVRETVMQNADKIQNIINVTEEGGHIKIPPGHYVVLDSIVPKRGQKIDGDGKVLLYLGDRVDKPVIVVKYDDIEIGHLSIDGNRAKQNQEYSTRSGDKGQWETNNGINVDGGTGGGKNISLHDLLIESCKSAGICTERGAKNIRITRAVLRKNEFDGLAGCETTDVTVKDCKFESNDAAGISLDHLCGNYLIINPEIRDNGDLAVYGRATRGITFRGGKIFGDVEISRNYARTDGQAMGVKFDGTKIIGVKHIKDGSDVTHIESPELVSSGEGSQ